INRCIHSDRSSVSNWTTLLKRDWLYRFLRGTEPLLHELSDLKRIINQCGHIWNNSSQSKVSILPNLIEILCLANYYIL
ncbi:hypothetical protein C0J52_09144, partial [Blattella germanica]